MPDTALSGSPADATAIAEGPTKRAAELTRELGLTAALRRAFVSGDGKSTSAVPVQQIADRMFPDAPPEQALRQRL